MGWRSRKSINIFPGVKLNINKKSVGVTFGGKGAHYTINSKGTKTSSVGIPGTGLYYTDSIRKKKKEENIKSNLKNNNIISPKRKSRSSLIFFIFVCLVLAGFISSWGRQQNENALDENTLELPTHQPVSLSCTEVLNLTKHPIIYSDFEKAKNFYKEMGIDNVKVLTVPEYSNYQNKLKSFSDDNVLMYLLADSTSKKYIGELHINIYEAELYSQMNAAQAIDIIVSYLPTDFFVYYQKDSSYKYSLNNTDINICSFRLNDQGIEYHNGGHEEYSYYYSFKIFHHEDIHRWIILTSYEAYGGKGLEWINKYSEPWEIDLNKYSNLQ